MILSSSLMHGVNYHYRIHKGKVSELTSEVPLLKNYLLEVMGFCPKEHFLEGPRSSMLRFKLPVISEKVTHEVSLLARIGLESEYYDNAHMNVQMFMLSYDNKTLAIEVPLWLTPSELEGFREFFDSDLSLSGHIDVLRVEEGKVWVWDFKPNARREKYATTQTYFYALMLSKRTGLPLSRFMCGYFDDKDVFVFDPSKVNQEELLRR